MFSPFKVAFLFAIFCISTCGYCADTPSSDYTVIQNQAKIPILTPSLAETETVKIRLKNGLEAYLISDPHADKSSAALTVKVGSWDEPSEYPGIAHFLEHMLFLGTKKYPSESEYSRYIAEHGGSTNAFTSSDFTSFLFSIDNSAFENALDRFSNFFKEPLFNPSGVARELQAIDQEYAKNRENDNVRELFVYKELASPAHPFHNFNTGNSTTLAKVSQETLKDWYHSHYSAHLMRLMVISPLPLEKLIELVIEDFKDVPTVSYQPSSLEMPIFSPQLNGKMVYVEPIKNIRTLTLVWDLPPQFSHMEQTKPDAILCYVLGDEGKNSLLALLKKENLAEKLSCSSGKLGPNNTQFFVEVVLTDNGIKNVDSVIERIFQTIANFRKKGVPQYLYDDLKRVQTFHYQYQTRDDAFDIIMKHAFWLPHEEMDTYPEVTQVIQKFDPQAVISLLDYLTPQNCHYDLLVPSSLTGIKPDKTEQWNGVSYAIEPIPQSVMESWEHATPNPNIDLPPPNPYLPESLSLVNIQLKNPGEQPIVPHPETILDDERGKIYYAVDRQFLTPQIGWIIEIETPQIQLGDADKVVCGDLAVKCITEALNAESYAATMAGINYEISRADNGIKIEIDGYSDKALLLLKTILKQFQDLQTTPEQFKIYKASQYREYQNFAFDPPISQAAEKMKSVLYKNFTTEAQKTVAIRKITFEKFDAYLKSLFNKVYFKGLLYGNMTEHQAKEIRDLLVNSFKGASYPLKEQLKTEAIILPNNAGPFYVEEKIKVEGNAAILGVEYPLFSFKNRAAQQVLMQAISEPFFGELRTRQQTGYVVYSTGEEVERRLFNFFAVQSNSHETRDLLARFELFIERYLQEIRFELPEERFNKIKQALFTSLKSPAKNIKAMAELMNTLAFKYEGAFDWIDRRIAGLTELSHEDCLKLSQEFLGRHNRRRFSILMNGILPESGVSPYSRLGSLQQLRQRSTYLTDQENP